jgi:hypothetical protein
MCVFIMNSLFDDSKFSLINRTYECNMLFAVYFYKCDQQISNFPKANNSTTETSVSFGKSGRYSGGLTHVR